MKRLLGYISLKIVLVITTVVLLFIPLLFFYGIWNQTKIRAERRVSIMIKSNLELVGDKLVDYAKSNNNYLPDANEWCDVLLQYDSGLKEADFKRPIYNSSSINQKSHLAFNRHLSKLNLTEIPGNVVLLFEADGGWNLSGSNELLRKRSAKKKYINILFVDGTYNFYWYSSEPVKQIQWKP